MSAKQPEQDLYDSLWTESKANGYKTFDYLPNLEDNPEFPFVQFDSTMTVPRATKTAALATVQMVINVWGSNKQRRAVSDISGQLFSFARTIRQLTSYHADCDLGASSLQIMRDTSIPNTMLWRGLLQLEFRIY